MTITVQTKKQPQTAEEYLSSLGYEDPQLQEGMKDALKMAFGKKITAANLKSLGMEGLKALSKSVLDQLKSSSKDTFIGIAQIKIPHHKFNFDLKIKENDTFLNAALEGDGKEILNEYLECVCGGNMSCSTCHIILDPISYSKLETPCEAELDMLDLAYEPQETSRLGCQVKMTKELDGMIVTIPSGVNNLWS